MTTKNEEKTRKKPKPTRNKWWKDPKIIIPIIVAAIGAFSITINLTPTSTPEIGLTIQPSSTNTPTETLSVADQISILGATATKSAERTATQFSIEVRSTIEADLTAQQIKTEIAAQHTQYAVETLQAEEQFRLLTETANTNATATVQASELWQKQHQFIDEFTQDIHEWQGDNKSAHVEVDQSSGILYFASKKESRISFWRCNLCSLPSDHKNYSFEVKYFAPVNPEDFNFGLVFGCTQFDSDLVSCQAIHIIDQSSIIIFRTGTSKIYKNISYLIKPNAKGLISVRWEVREQILKLWINDQLAVTDIQLDGGGGGMFGFYADPPGSTVSFERMEIYPLTP